MNARILGILGGLTICAAFGARAQTYVWSGQAVQGGNGHYYGIVTPGPDLPCGQYVGYSTARSFAKQLKVNGWPGHMITLNSPTEFSDPPVRDLLSTAPGWVGAIGIGANYTHDDGPEAGQHVSFFGRLLIQPEFGSTCSGLVFPRLVTEGEGWYGRREAGYYCDAIVCTRAPGNFVVEFEPDLDPPVLNLSSFPTPGAAVFVGAQAQVAWTSSDVWSGVEAARVLLSRAGPDGVFDELATGLPASGIYAWTVSAPTTAPNMAVFAVEVRDAAGHVTLQRTPPFTIAVSVPISSRKTSWAGVKSRFR